MVGALFHRWERHLASVSKDRVVRPFDWGLDWLHLGPPVPETAAAVGPLVAAPSEAVTAWVNAVMENTPDRKSTRLNSSH